MHACMRACGAAERYVDVMSSSSQHVAVLVIKPANTTISPSKLDGESQSDYGRSATSLRFQVPSYARTDRDRGGVFYVLTIA
jgi:hypothetical protein